LTFPDNDQPDAPFAAVGSEVFVSPITGTRIWGYLAFSAGVSVPITTISFNDGSVLMEFEVGAPPPDSGLPIEWHIVGTQEFRDAILKSARG
jgi:hypothetical protein